MISLQIQSCNQGEAKAIMLVEYSAEVVDIAIIHKEQQFDFALDKSEWEQVKLFIETAIQQEK